MKKIKGLLRPHKQSGEPVDGHCGGGGDRRRPGAPARRHLRLPPVSTGGRAGRLRVIHIFHSLLLACVFTTAFTKVFSLSFLI